MFTDTKWWHTQEETVVCDLCPRECKLHEGQRGFCFVRQNVNQRMVLTTYGRSTGFCIDPIEKKPLNHFLPGTAVLSFGTAGCNLGCKFCQNWSISKAKEIERLSETASPKAIAQAALNNGCHSVAFTYNDPVIWAEYAIDTAKACRDLGIKTVAVTAGYITPHARPDFYRYIDAANVDLKAFTETFYKYLTFSKLAPVLDTLKWLKQESDVWFEITNLIIPQENDSPDELRQMCGWIVENLGTDVPVHFTAFHPDFRLRNRPSTPPETLVMAHEIAREAGIKFPYVGNVHDGDRQSTFCPQCKTLLLQRDWYEIGQYRLNGNRCSQCGTVIPGVFAEKPGNWGARRQPIIVRDPVPTINPPQINERKTGGEVPPQTISETAPTPMVDFTPAQQEAIASYTRSVAESAVRQTPFQTSLAKDLAEAPTFGIFVTATRAGCLRACRGRWGKMLGLQELLHNATCDSVLADPRFPRIQPEELPFLSLQVSLMYEPQQIIGAGDQRVAEVRVGEHGLVLHHPSGKGLLLPQVATEHGWDAVTFLEHVSLKAGLARDAWKDPAAKLMTFKAILIDSPAPQSEFDPRRLADVALRKLAEALNDLLHGKAVDRSAVDHQLSETYACQMGLHFRLSSGMTGFAAGPNRTLLSLAEFAAGSIAGQVRRDDRIAQIHLLWEPVRLDPEDYPQRHRTLASHAVLGVGSGRWAFVLPERRRDPVRAVLSGLKQSVEIWQESNNPVLTAFSVYPVTVRSVKQHESRPAARAGQFYPASESEMNAQVEQFLAAGQGPAEECRAIMLPHAGWIYCGTVIGKTLGKVRVPDKVIVIGPKHTPYGPNFSVTSADEWQIPGRSIPIWDEFRQQLLQRIPSLECESQAHRLEHGTEVLLPFLIHLNPNLQVLPIVLGPCSFEETAAIAAEIRNLIKQLEPRPLLVISSDMNHFATEAENRRRDFLALEAMLTGEPRLLYDTCKTNQISMCGMLPAVTVMQALETSKAKGSIQLIDYTNSGQVTGDMRRVVGYAGVVLK